MSKMERVAVADGWNSFHLEEYDSSLKALGRPSLEKDARFPLEDPGADAVVVAARPEDTYAAARAALEAGKHVFCDKCLAMTASQVEELWALAENRGLQLAFEFPFTRRPACTLAKECLDRGLLGEVRSLFVNNAHGALLAGTLPPQFLQSPGGVLYDIGAHPLYLALWLMGEPERVSAACLREKEGCVHTYHSLLQYPGASACCSGSYRWAEGMFSVTLMGEKGSYCAQVQRGSIRYLALPKGLRAEDLPASALPAPGDTDLGKWLTAIREGTPPDSRQKELGMQLSGLLARLLPEH